MRMLRALVEPNEGVRRPGRPLLILLALALAIGLVARPAAARATLEQRCARCHGADGRGKSMRADLPEIPDFASHRWQAGRSDAQLLVSILDGKGTHMPAYRGKISDKEARELVAQVRALDPAPAARAGEKSPDDFQQRYRHLEEELAELKKRFREASEPPPRKP